jgi:glycosyltransferase involved in cell wall biosynthesis
MKTALIDVCLPTRNSSKDLPRLMDCLHRQLETSGSRLLVADGSSSDTTLEIIRRSIPRAKIVSSSDFTPEQGINRLFECNPENIKLLIGSDDWISSNYLQAMASAASDCFQRGIKRFVLLPSRFINVSKNRQWLSRIPLRMISMMGVGRGIGWAVFDHCGAKLMSEELRYASDYEYLLRCYSSGYKFVYVDCTYYHNKSGRSSDSLLVGIFEEYKIACGYRRNKFGARTMLSFLLLALKAIIRALSSSLKG